MKYRHLGGTHNALRLRVQCDRYGTTGVLYHLLQCDRRVAIDLVHRPVQIFNTGLDIPEVVEGLT